LLSTVKKGECEMNILDFYRKKKNNEKITVITCYDYTSARIIANTSIDCVLVGDSGAMTMHGFKDTIPATISMMCFHTSAVSRGISDQFLVSDMPFLSYRKSLSKSVSAAQELMQAGAHAVKLESVDGNLQWISHLVASGIPVMGHIGMTPQFINILGGFKAQGKSAEEANRLKEEALALQHAGCFAIVLECVPSSLAQEITQSLSIPTIGIGAGPFTGGQVLVFQDLLGLNVDFKPKLAKAFINGYEQFKTGIEAYVQAVKTGGFPADEHCY
jgi:3-methyl-2-oxobutanoate hydroxymethyltransferase